MKKLEYYIKIKDKEIPIRIRNYQNSNHLKIYFKGNFLQVSKPKYYSENKLLKVIRKNEEQIYEQYCKILSKENDKLKHWYTGEQILYKGDTYIIEIKRQVKDEIHIQIDEDQKKFEITIPENLLEEEKKQWIDKSVKQLFKINTEEMLQTKLPYWSKITNITYKTYKVRDTISKYGSCIPKTKMLHFNARLVMLPEDKIDAIIVHELCHIIHPNHSKEFYNLVKQYIPDYDVRNQWLKKNQKLIMI